MARHNKKRNTGLVYEFLARFIANSIVESDTDGREKAHKIVNEHFRKGTELYREFRLFSALVSTTVSSELVANGILQEAKVAARKYDDSKLNHEKSLLIRNINHQLNKGRDFYSQQVAEYTQFATVQQLLNEWRLGTDADIAKIAEYEDKLRTWLLEKKEKAGLQDQKSEDSDALVVKLMTQKLNEKYSDLGDDEKEILKLYVFQEHKEELIPRLKVLKEQTVAGIDSYLEKAEMGKNQELTEKLSGVREAIVRESIEEVNDELIEHFLDISKLKEEIACQN